MYNYNSGYKGYSMSNRAVEAYEDGKKPISKWNKNDIINAIIEYASDNDISINYDSMDLSKLTKGELTRFLYCSEWHHTSNHFNRTDFYSIDEDVVGSYSKEKINEVISNRKPKERKENIQKLFITSLVQFDYWTGTRNHPKKEVIVEVVNYRSDDKMVKTSCGNKRLSSLIILKSVSQKTKYAKKEKVQK